MVYLIDANVLITAANVHYPIDVFPVFWDWLEYQIVHGRIRMPREIFDEVKDGGDDEEVDLLFAWIQREHLKEALVLEEEADVDIVQSIMAASYSPLNDIQLEQIGQDPFLVAYAKADEDDRCVVTYEKPAPHTAPQNRKVPDACATAGVRWCDPMRMLRDLGFSSNWQPPAV